MNIKDNVEGVCFWHRIWYLNLSKVTCATLAVVHESTSKILYYINVGLNLVLHGREYDKPEVTVAIGGGYIDIANETSSDAGFRALFDDVRKRLDKTQIYTLYAEYRSHSFHIKQFGERTRFYWMLPNIILELTPMYLGLIMVNVTNIFSTYMLYIFYNNIFVQFTFSTNYYIF